ncbi:MAG: Holliday junction resolvase RuvX [Fimbriimonadaceae bacterium]|nr:MAG: Holliday junction resolvase RuvX [Fimbriimonadaceae bacterium]
MRVLGVDLGKARIGLAVMETETGLSRALQPISAKGALKSDAQQVFAAGKQELAEGYVLGLPLENGLEGKMASVMRRFGAELEALGGSVFYVDESLTSVEASTAMHESGMKASQRKKRLDSEAACRILDRFKESHV